MKNIYSFLLCAIVILAFLLRVYALGVIPPGLTNDEADIGYDAYSILKTGHDQWGNFLPLTSFKGFGDYRLPVYTYLTIPFITFFNLTPLSVRLPSAFLGTVSVLLIYFVSRKLSKKLTINATYGGLAAAFLFAISPWSIGLSRIGIESNVAITFMLCAILAFLQAFDKPKLFILATAFFVLTIYTYTSYSLFTLLIILAGVLLFRKKIFKQKKVILFSAFLFAVLVFPLFIFKSTAGVRASQISFINSQDNIGLLTNLNDRRGSCVEKFPVLLCKITENKQIVFTNTFVRNYLNHFSANLLYLNGTTTQYSILPQRSLLYTIEILFLVAGVLFTFKFKSKPSIFILIILLLSPIPDALTGDGHYSRASGMMPFLFILEGLGIMYIWKILNNLQKILAWTFKFFIVLIVSYSFISFFVSYFSYFPKYFSNYSQYGYEEWAQKLNDKKERYDRIYLSRYGNDTKQYVYYLFYNKYNPVDFQNKKSISYMDPVGGWVSIDRIDNLFFVDRVPAEKDLEQLKNKKILLVTHPTELPKDFNLKQVEDVKDKNGNKVFIFLEANNLLKYYTDQKETNNL